MLAGHDVVFLALPHGASAAVAESLGEDVARRSTAARTSGWPTPRRGRASTAPSTPAPGRTACRSCPVPATPCAAPRGSPYPGCYPTVSSLALAPALAARPGRPRRRRGRGVRHQRRRQGRSRPNLLGSEVMGQRLARTASAASTGTPPRSSRTSAPSPADRSPCPSPRSSCRCRAASSPPARPRSCRACTADDARAAYLEAYADEPFVHLLPPGQWPQTQAVLGSNAVHLQVTVDERAGRLVAVGAVDNLTKGTAGAAVQCMNLALGLDETTGLPPWGWRRDLASPADTPSLGAPGPMSARPGFTAAGVEAGPQDQRRQGRRRSSSTTARPTPPPRCSPANRCKANPVLWSEQVVAGRRREGRVPQLGRRQLLHRPRRLPDHPRRRRAASPTGSALGAIDVLVCSTGLIGLANPREQVAGRRRRGVRRPGRQRAATTPRTRS